MTFVEARLRVRKALAGRKMDAPPRSDLALAVVLAVLGALDAAFGFWRGPAEVNAVVVTAMALSLAWRRRRPLTVLAIVAGGLIFLSLMFGGSETPTAVFIMLVAIYSAAAHGSDLPVALALIAAADAVQTLTDPDNRTFGDHIWDTIMFGFAFLVGLGMRRHEARTAALEERADELQREQEARAAEAAGEERQRIARELHDIVSHSLGVLVLQAGAAEQVLDRDPERARGALRSIRATGQEAIGEMGTLLGLVRSGAEASREPQPSLADLEGLVERTREAGLPVDLTVEGHRRALPAALELSAFRIVQEGLTNALKHSGNAPTRVVVRYRAEDLEVNVTDEGAGPSNGLGGGRGLAGMRERVTVFGGQLEAGPVEEGGWVLRVRLPFER